MSGLDEARAHSVLADMQDRLARDPIAALGLRAGATAEDVRTAFLALTKQFHPVRFGRMAPEIQRLANEVFLSLRAAHDTLARSLRRPSSPSVAGVPGAASTRSRALTPFGVPVMPAVPQAGAISGNGRTGPVPVRSTRPPPNEPGERAAFSPPSAVGSGVMRPSQPPSTSAKTVPLRPPVPQGVAQPIAAPTRPPAAPPIAAAASEAAVLELLERRDWDQARSMLHQLAAAAPSSRRIRGLMCYARGREAQLDQRLDDARVELQDALDLDPNLQIAKAALTELFTMSRRRK